MRTPDPRQPVDPRRVLRPARSAAARAVDVLTWIGTAVSLTALLVVAGLVATAAQAPTPTGVSTATR